MGAWRHSRPSASGQAEILEPDTDLLQDRAGASAGLLRRDQGPSVPFSRRQDPASRWLEEHDYASGTIGIEQTYFSGLRMVLNRRLRKRVYTTQPPIILYSDRSASGSSLWFYEAVEMPAPTLVLVGESKIGKTTLVNYMVCAHLSERTLANVGIQRFGRAVKDKGPTIEDFHDFSASSYSVDGHFSLLDTGGAHLERYLNHWIKRAEVLILVYNNNSVQSLLGAAEIHGHVQGAGTRSTPAMILLENRFSLNKNQEVTKQGRRFAKRKGLRFVDAEANKEGCRKVIKVALSLYDHAKERTKIEEKYAGGGRPRASQWKRSKKRLYDFVADLLPMFPWKIYSP